MVANNLFTAAAAQQMQQRATPKVCKVFVMHASALHLFLYLCPSLGMSQDLWRSLPMGGYAGLDWSQVTHLLDASAHAYQPSDIPKLRVIAHAATIELNRRDNDGD